jgi:hypothetical protein
MKPDVSKLPKWAQEYIDKIEREREVAVKALNDYCDSQTKSPVYIQELESTGEQKGPSFKMRYIQTRRIAVEWQGVHMELLLREEGIGLQWRGERLNGDIAFIPRSYQQAYLVAKDKMRG